MTLTAPPGLGSGHDTALAPIRVLFVDDSTAIRTLARFSLTAARGFVVTEAANGADALTLFGADRPDCVVLDIQLPGIGGFEVLEELQRRCPEVPVVMLSGFSDPAATTKAKAGGAVAYLEKSSELGQLPDTVRRVTEASNRPLELPPQVEPNVEAAESPAAGAETAELRRLEYLISHDLAEPVRIMRGFATLLASRHADSLDDSGRAFVGHINDGAQRMQAMIDDLLAYARAGRVPSVAELVDVEAVVHQAIGQLDSLIAGRGADVAAGELPAACGDPTLLKTVLRHVLVNALTFNTSTTPLVRVDGHLANGLAVFTVTDNGIGVSPAHHEDVFELFRRLNTREEYQGTGTGLALCRRLLNLQHGTISLGSTKGGGTTVTLTLPGPDTHSGERS